MAPDRGLTLLGWVIGLCAMGCSGPDLVCKGDACACESDEDCVLTAYHSPVDSAAQCYCDDISCGTSVPLRGDAAADHERSWRDHCANDAMLCATTMHCYMHPPEHAECVGSVCAKYVDD